MRGFDVNLSGMLDRWYGWRDRWLGNASFRRWASAFPLTRPVARRRAAEVFDLCAGFVYSQTLLACVRLRLLEILAERPHALPAIARRTGLTVERARCLIEAAVALRLVASRGGDRYGLGDLGATIAGDPAIQAMVEHQALLYADLRDPVALLRDAAAPTALSAYWPYAGEAAPAALDATGVAAYSTLMAVSQSLVAQQAIAAFRFADCRRMLDVGGGEGAFIAAVAAHAPRLDFVLFDLPAVAQRARSALAAAGLAARVRIEGGDFLRDPLPAGADVVTLVRVLHDHDDADALTLLRAVHRALPPGGRVVVAEPMAGAPSAPRSAAYFAFYLRALGRGRPRRPDEVAAMLASVGFVDAQARPTPVPLQVGVVVAQVAGARAVT